MTTFEPGFAGAMEPTGTAVREALLAADVLDHPLFGPSTWGGAEIYGANHHLMTPLPIYSVDEDGLFFVSSVVDVAEWWDANKAYALPKLEAAGQTVR